MRRLNLNYLYSLFLFFFCSCSPLQQSNQMSQSSALQSTSLGLEGDSNSSATGTTSNISQSTNTLSSGTSSSTGSSSSSSEEEEEEDDDDDDDEEEEEEQEEEEDEDLTLYYYDGDDDGQGDPNNTIRAESRPDGYVSNSLDCDDSDENIYSGADEVCGDGVDSDCDGFDPSILYPDEDEDGYGDPNGDTLEANESTCTLTKVSIYGTDCNDDNALQNPETKWYEDYDEDGFGDANGVAIYTQCEDPSNSTLSFTRDNTDCNDKYNDVYPDSTATECNADADCDGNTDLSDCVLMGTEILSETSEEDANGMIFSMSCPDGMIMLGCTCHEAHEGCSGGSYMEVDSDGNTSCNAASSNDEGITLTAQCIHIGHERDSNFFFEDYDLMVSMSSDSNTGDDDEVTASCDEGYTLTSCNCYSEGNDCGDGAYLKTDLETCKAQADGDGDAASVQAVATCLKLGSDFSLTTERIKGDESESSDEKTSVSTCSEDYFLSGCSCKTDYANCDDGAIFSSENTCTAYRDSSPENSHGVRSFATCLTIE